jgi:putative oxidoreductase
LRFASALEKEAMANAHGSHWDLGFLRNWSAQIALVGRPGLAYVFIVDGWQAIANSANVGDYMQANGVRAFAAVGHRHGARRRPNGRNRLCRALGGNRPGRVLPADRAIFHRDSGDAEQVINFQKNIAMAGGFLMLAASGPGGWSIDAWRTKQADADDS